MICLQTLEHLEDPKAVMLNLIKATEDVLIVGVPYREARPSENHVWSFDENDFAEFTDAYYIDKRQKNIYWLVDKQKKHPRFYEKRFSFLSSLRKIFYNTFGNLVGR